SPYVVDNTVQVFQNSAVLTVESGVTIKFYNDAGMNFNNAAIQARGATGSPIVFTSFYDDEYAGDTNADATSSAPSIGDWYGVDIVSGSGSSILDRAIFRYGGKYYSPTSEADRVIVKIENTPDISVKNSVFEYSKAHGLVLVNSTSTVENSIFRNNNNYSEQGKGLFVAGNGNYSIKNNEFSQNQTGLYLSDAAATVDTNTFSNNTQKAVYSYGLLGKFTNNNVSQNGKNGIVLGGNLAAAGSTSTFKADNIAYVFSEENPVVPANSALEVESGAIIKGSGNGLQVNGRLALGGENSGDIILTSLYDDSVGGDTDNSVNSPGPGNWPGINLASGASLIGKGFTIRYAGSQSSGGNDSAGIKLTTGLASITNALFEKNYPYGIFALTNSNLNITNSRFENHNYSGPWGTKAALAVYNSTTTLNNVSFVNNLLGIASDAVSTWIASGVEFINNTATTSPGGLF
ncbi:MAG: right-handed parallel beta-helix repeat-containing protein, partial [Patescibacteria group bacterium]